MRQLQEMTPGQILRELRTELTASERIRELLLLASKNHANKHLRGMYRSNDAASLIRVSGHAEGVEIFVADITKLPDGTVLKDRG